MPIRASLYRGCDIKRLRSVGSEKPLNISEPRSLEHSIKGTLDLRATVYYRCLLLWNG